MRGSTVTPLHRRRHHTVTSAHGDVGEPVADVGGVLAPPLESGDARPELNSPLGQGGALV